MREDTVNNIAESTIIGFSVSFIFNALMNWALHTVGALLSGLVVTAGIFFFQRYLKKIFK